MNGTVSAGRNHQKHQYEKRGHGAATRHTLTTPKHKHQAKGAANRAHTGLHTKDLTKPKAVVRGTRCSQQGATQGREAAQNNH